MVVVMLQITFSPLMSFQLLILDYMSLYYAPYLETNLSRTFLVVKHSVSLLWALGTLRASASIIIFWRIIFSNCVYSLLFLCFISAFSVLNFHVSRLCWNHRMKESQLGKGKKRVIYVNSNVYIMHTKIWSNLAEYLI